MTWHGIREHDSVVEQFRRALGRGRLASTFLFVGPEGVGKRAFALKLAQALLCERVPEERLDPCEHCPACLQVTAGTHPDLELVARPEGRSGLLVEQFIGSLEKRGQEGMCHNLARRPMMGTRRMAIIDDADTLDGEAANCLLKLLEEPPPRSVLILVGTSAEMQLPTIRSRCQLVRFSPLSRGTVADLLLEHGLTTDASQAERLAGHSEGSLARGTELADPALWEFRRQLLEGLSARAVNSVRLAQETTVFVDEAGSEAPPRRARARQVIGFAAEFYRQLARSLSGLSPPADDELRGFVARAQASWPGDAETAADCAARCLEALEHVDRNANLSSALECWVDEITRPMLLIGRH